MADREVLIRGGTGAAREVLVKLRADTASYQRQLQSAATTTTKLSRTQAGVTRTSKLKADTTQYTASMTKARKATEQVEKAQTRSQRVMAGWKEAGVASTIGATAIAAGLWKATQAASDQEQAMGALDAVFREQSPLMQKYARDAVQMGMSTTEYAQSASTLGGMLGNLGISQDELAGTTDALLKAGSDLAAQFGGQTTDAVDALTAAMRGEADPAERYALSLNETAVKAEMAATGLDKTHARISLIQKQMAKSGAAGAWNKQIGTAAEQTQIAQAAFKNAAADLGNSLLPALTSAAQAASKFLGWFSSLPEPIKTATTAVALFTGGALLIGPRLAEGISALKKFAEAIRAASIAENGLSGLKGAGGIVTAVTALVLASEGLAVAQSNVTGESLRATTALNEFTLLSSGPGGSPFAALVEGARQLGTQLGWLPENLVAVGDGVTRLTLPPGASKEMQLYADALNNGAGDVQVFADALNAGKTPAEAFSDATGKTAQSANQLAQETADASSKVAAAGGDMKVFTDALNAGKTPAEALAAATKGVASSSTKAAEAQKKEAAAARELRRNLSSLLEMNLALIGNEDALLGQTTRVSKAYRKFGTDLHSNTAAAAKNRAAIGEEVTKIDALAQATYDRVKATQGEAAAQRASNQVIRKHMGVLRDTMIQTGYTRDEVDRYIGRLHAVPAHVRTRVETLWAERIRTTFDLFGVTRRKASGGLVSGPGTATSDSIPARLSNGEYVLRAAAVKRIGVPRLDAMNYATGGLVARFAAGGSVRRTVRDARDRRADQVADWVPRLRASETAVTRLTGRSETLRDRWDDLRQSAVDLSKSVKDNVVGSLRLMDTVGWKAAKDSDAHASALDRVAATTDAVADATDKYYAAQVALNTASPAERAAATKALADAEDALAGARRDAAAAAADEAAAAVTPANILQGAKAQADAARKYAATMRSLIGKGMSADLIQQLAGTDPAQAAPMMAALDAMTKTELAALNGYRTAATQAADAAARMVSGDVYGAQITAAGKAVKAVDRQTAAAKRHLQVVREARPATVRETLAKQALRSENDRLTAATARHGTALQGTTRDAKANRQALSDEAGIIVTAAKATYDRVLASQGEAAAVAAANAVVRDHARDLIDNATAAGMSKDAVKDYLDKLGLLPADVRIPYDSPGLSDTVLSTGELSRVINGIPDRKDTRLGVDGSQVAPGAQQGQRDLNTHFPGRNAPLDTDNSNVGPGADYAQGLLRIRFMGRNAPLDTDNERVAGGADAAQGIIRIRFLGRNAPLDTDNSRVPTGADAAQGKLREKFPGRNAPLDTDNARVPTGAQAAQGKLKEKFPGRTAPMDVVRSATFNKNLASIASQVAVAFARLAINITAVTVNGRRTNSAVGGLITGPGTGTSDSIPAMLSNGEYVIRAASVNKIGVPTLNALNRGDLASPRLTPMTAPPIAPVSTVRVAPIVVRLTGGAPIVVKMDSRDVYRGQLELRRRSGDTYQLAVA